MAGDQQPLNTSRKLSERLDVNFALQAAGLGVWEFDPASNQVLWDERCRALFGLAANNRMSYEQAFKYVHPDDVAQVNQAAQWAMNAQSNGVFDQTYRTLGVDDEKLRWVHFQGKVDFTPSGEVNRFAGVAQEVTQQMLDKQQLVDQQALLQNIVQQTPAPTLVLRGDEYIIEQINQLMLAFMGRDEEVIGRPLLATMPELATQAAWQQVQRVYQEGVNFDQTEVLVSHVRHGVLQNIYYNVSYRPLREDGQITGVIQVAIDVTEQVLANQQIKETEETMRGVLDVADMGTWTLNMLTGQTSYSIRLKQLFEFTEDVVERERLYNPILDSDRERVAAAVKRASDPDSGGLLDEEYTVVTQRTGRHRIVRAQAKMYFDEQRQPKKLVGSMRDITQERQSQVALAQQVQQRTEELAATSEELAAINEELAVSNEELIASNEKLEEANGLLIRSNDNLQTFAAVASHDLQEPLRKIQQFGDILRTQYGPHLGEGIDYLHRMQLSASRMSTLIKDLLSFSRISTQRNTEEPVSLGQVVSGVLGVLDMAIAELTAQVQVDNLPTVLGDASQLSQLFQNLISNALKFHRPGVSPQIRISSQLVKADELPPSSIPTRRTPYYHRLEVADNGVGFDEKYVDRIFQVFQRLHGKNEFAGTGVGLAICEKVVANHGGVITASSQVGQGATFGVYLPVYS